MYNLNIVANVLKMNPSKELAKELFQIEDDNTAGAENEDKLENGDLKLGVDDKLVQTRPFTSEELKIKILLPWTKNCIRYCCTTHRTSRAT